ncbi:hypothetical protein ATANTOWER_002092 [Ataeniobius toweri]|uniref:Anosmin-1 cysteine rich domain-containing protein n=1 Tax=Ataeniobius toweri TaxID=208326 RepID=A0ABU7CI14_9TELE|nr:hypothetical protein [Ataeniobius toweri]
MPVIRAVLVLLCLVLTMARARRSSPEPEDVQEKINSARCTSRCLSLHMTQLTAAFRHIQWVAGELVPISNSLWARGGVHPGQVASPSQGNKY